MPPKKPTTSITPTQHDIATRQECIEILTRIATGNITTLKPVVRKGEIEMVEVYPTFNERRQAMKELQNMLRSHPTQSANTKTIRIEFISPAKD
jgi:hypothetical protein